MPKFQWYISTSSESGRVTLDLERTSDQHLLGFFSGLSGSWIRHSALNQVQKLNFKGWKFTPVSKTKARVIWQSLRNPNE